MNNTHKTNNKPLQTAISRIAVVGATFNNKAPAKKKSELNLHVLPLNKTALIHGIVFTPYANDDYYIKVKNVSNNTRVAVDEGEFDYMEKITTQKRVKIINRGLVNNNTAIEVDVIVEKYHTPSPKNPATGNTVSFLKKAMVSTTTAFLSIPVAAATQPTAEGTDWLLLGGATFAIYLFASILSKAKHKQINKSLAEINAELENDKDYQYETKVLNGNEFLCDAYRNGWKPEQIAKRWKCSVSQVKRMANNPNKYQIDAFNGLPWNGEWEGDKK